MVAKGLTVGSRDISILALSHKNRSETNLLEIALNLSGNKRKENVAMKSWGKKPITDTNPKAAVLVA